MLATTIKIMVRAVTAKIAAWRVAMATKVMARASEAENVANSGCGLSRSGQNCGSGGQSCHLVWW